jgi:hypothetical protein
METLGLVVGLLVLSMIVVRTIVRVTRRTLGTPLRIQVVPVADPEAGRYAATHGRELQEFGFEPLGVYSVPQMRGVVLTAFAQPSEGVCAIVYSHPVGIFFDLSCVTTGDIGLTVSTAPAGENLDRPPGRSKIFARELSLRQAYDRLLAERPAGPYQHVNADNFARIVETEYAREMDWRAQRGGVTEGEVRREAAAMTITSEETIQKATRKMQEQFAAASRRDAD